MTKDNIFVDLCRINISSFKSDNKFNVSPLYLTFFHDIKKGSIGKYISTSKIRLQNVSFLFLSVEEKKNLVSTFKLSYADRRKYCKVVVEINYIFLLEKNLACISTTEYLDYHNLEKYFLLLNYL